MQLLISIKSLQGTERPINSWSVENAVYQADKMSFVYADLNKDGVEEQLIGVEQSNSDYFISGLYYLVNEKPILFSRRLCSKSWWGQKFYGYL